MTPERAVIENLFMVADKASQDVPFKLNSAQAHIDDNFAPRLVIPKARQEGVSTYFLARNTVKCLGYRNTRAVVISHDTESTERMLLKVKYFLENLKGPKAIIKNSNKNEITFPKTNSMLYIGTAGSRKFGRGDTITDLHCSEVAYWPSPKETMTGLLQAVPKGTGHISIESTGNGAGNWYHNLCMRAAKGDSAYRLIFLPWHTFPEYTLHPSEEEALRTMEHLREDLEEPALVANYKLTPGQVLWRRLVIEDEMEGDLFQWKKEYPACLDDCFQVAGSGVFQRVNFEETDNWTRCDEVGELTPYFWKLKDHPMPHLHYIVGADVSGGVGKDSSVAEVFCLETEEQVGEYVNNRLDPDVFADKLAIIGRHFNMAYIGVESNNHGLLTLSTLIGHDYSLGAQRYPGHLIYRTPAPLRRSARDEVKRAVDLGVRTSVRSKPYIIGVLRRKLSSTAVIHSPILKNELSTFVEHEDGSMGAAENCHDDTVIAAAMSFFVQNRGALVLSDNPLPPDLVHMPKHDPFSLESIIEELRKRGSGVGQFFPPHISGIGEL